MRFPLFRSIALPNRVAIFVDGGYLDKVLESEFPNADLSYQKLSTALAGDSDLLRTYYYHSLPYQGTPPNAEQQARYSGRRSFFNALKPQPPYYVIPSVAEESKNLEMESRPAF